MPETAAAGAMDAIYRHQRYIYDLTRRNYLIGRDALIAELDPPLGGAVLEIGCGTARNLIRAARIYPAARFYGIDVSHEMLKTAQASIARSPMHSAIRVAHADATAFCSSDLFGLDGLDRVFISYALSMIPAWEAVIDRAVSALAPTGALHIVDFGTMATMPELPRRALRAWLAHFSVTPRDNLEEAVREAARHAGCDARFQEGRFGYAARAEIGPKLS
jgi:S-adenosylmethionine-diacylgycerolhomoserine-N-methlytransferase